MADQTPNSSYGLLQVNVINIENNFPVQNARITISSSENPRQTVEQLTTNTSGQTEQVRKRRQQINGLHRLVHRARRAALIPDKAWRALQ